jgi:hypothetical protein
MSIRGRRITALAAAAVLCSGLSRKGMAQMADTTAVIIETATVTVYRTKAPAKVPIAKSETKGAAPSAAAIWVPGYWNFQGNQNTAPRGGWAWVPGRWLTPPVQGGRWDPAHWGWANEWWSWIPGHWVQPGPHGFPPSLQSDEMSQNEISQ